MNAVRLAQCPPPLVSKKIPSNQAPRSSWDSHCHLFGSPSDYSLAQDATYGAPEATLDDYRALLARLGLSFGVFVTSTVYGTNNRLLQESLARAPGWLRGIAVIDETVSDAMLENLDEAGVRGFRVNLMYRSRGSHFRGGVGFEALEPLAARTAQLGWHAQLWCDSKDLGELAPVIRRLPVDCVIDHFGRTPADRGVNDDGFRQLAKMLGQGEVFAKISGAYRLSKQVPYYPDVAPMARRLIEAAPDRLVWGTDWPHPNFAEQMPDDADLLDLLFEWCDNDSGLIEQILVHNPVKLYGRPTDPAEVFHG